MKKQPDECRAWLESYGELKLEAMRMTRRRRQLLDQATQITSRISPVPGGGSGDKEKLLAALADAEGEAYRKETEALERYAEIEQFIDAIPTPESRTILRLRYLDRLRWADVRRAMTKSNLYYEERQIYRLHGQALREARAEWNRRKEHG